jgi:putative transposase
VPWEELCTMSVREQFVLRAKEPGANIAALCREHGISRKTGYKWIERYDEGGLSALEDMSRRPHTSPLQVSGDVVADVVQLRVAHPTWGSKKLAEILRRKYGSEAPSKRTVARILVRSGLVQQSRRRRQSPEVHFGPPTVQPKTPNDLWTADFKGWWLAASGERCEPLTVRDAYSRFVLAIDVLSTTSAETVKAVFERLFEKYGVPKAILTDGGSPFVAAYGSLGLTTLNVWWLSLGIEHYRSRPATPSDNGAHERLHKDIAAELEAFAALNRRAQQDACDRWRHDFNHHRPHEALAMRMPYEVYRRSDIVFDKAKAIDVVYPSHFITRLVSQVGVIKWRGGSVFISGALAARTVGLEPLTRRQFHVWFAHRRLGLVDFSTTEGVFTPAPWNDGLNERRVGKPSAESNVA